MPCHSSASSAARPRSGPRALSGGGAATYISGHLTTNATRALAMAFPPVDRKVSYRRASKMPRVQGGNVMLRQTGAMLGLDTAEREGWWSGYDWVIRLNPDVIVRN